MRTSDFIIRTIAENTMLFPVGKMSDLMQGAIILNELSQYVWELLDTPKSEDEIVAAIVNTYDVSSQIAHEHIHLLILDFEHYCVIQEYSSKPDDDATS